MCIATCPGDKHAIGRKTTRALIRLPSSPNLDKSALEARLRQEGASAFRKPEEFFVSTDFFVERETVIPPDVALTQDEDLGGMLFHVF